MIYISTLMKIGSGIEKLRGRTLTHSQEGDFVSLLLFSKAENYAKKIN
jgi:hypothetical protein